MYFAVKVAGGLVRVNVCVLTGVRVTEVRQSHGVELSSVCDGSVQQAAATP